MNGECPECGFEGDFIESEPCPECGAPDAGYGDRRKGKLNLSGLNWKYGRHVDTGAPAIRDKDSKYDEIVLVAEIDDHPSYSPEVIRHHAIFAAKAPAMLRQALYACKVAKEAIENPDLLDDSRTEAYRDAWRYLNHALKLAEKFVDLEKIEGNIQEPPPHSI